MPELLVDQSARDLTKAEHVAVDAEAVERARAFMEQEIPALQKVTGLAVDVQIGKGWATDLTTGNFTVDPNFFLERGYSSEHAVHTTFHELMAHVRDARRDPVYAARQRAFGKRGKADHLFINILTDIHGDKLTAAMFPKMAEVGVDIYESRLFPLEKDGEPVDYAALPLHVQFMYKMIRQEMIPGSETPVRPEVDEALAGLRDYKGTGQDIITLLTKPGLKQRELDPTSESVKVTVSGSDRFDYQLATIYPVYQALLEQAKQEAAEKQQQSGEGVGSGDNQGETTESQPHGSGSEPTEAESALAEQSGDASPFDDTYADYFENKHPEPMSEDQEKALDDMIRKAVKELHQQTQAPNPTRELDKSLRETTGFGLREHQDYSAEIEKHQEAVNAMRDVYQSVIQERVAQRRGLSRQSYAEGDILNPNRLPQLIIDKKAGVSEPEVFTRYEHIRRRTELVGKTDYIFVFDRSSSMAQNGGEKKRAAVTSALILLEALAGMERDIKEAEERTGLELDLDIRTALYTFNDSSECIKQLSPGLSDKERLSVRQSILRPTGRTADFLALDEIAAIPTDRERQRIVIAVSDGESDDAEHAARAIERLRQQGVLVFGVGIGSDAATRLYAPNSRRVDNPANLPNVLQSFIESTLR